MNTHFSVISVGCNCQGFLGSWHDSLRQQSYDNWTAYVALDPSTDGSARTLDWLEAKDERIHVMGQNTQRQGAMHNMYSLINKCVHICPNEDTVVVVLDLDDMLKPNALARVAKEYSNPGVWMTYGSYEATDGRNNSFNRRIPDEVWRTNTHRSTHWSASHLRTFRRKLFMHVPVINFTFEDGLWYNRATDHAMMYPLLELCGDASRAVFIPDQLYVYRVYGQIEKNREEENKCLPHIKARTPLVRLSCL